MSEESVSLALILIETVDPTALPSSTLPEAPETTGAASFTSRIWIVSVAVAVADPSFTLVKQTHIKYLSGVCKQKKSFDSVIYITIIYTQKN